jgi:hypothetical protein
VLKQATGPSSPNGFSTLHTKPRATATLCGEGKWKAKKHSAEYSRAWRKVQLAIDAVTLDVWAVEMTDYRQGGAAQTGERLSQLDPAEPLASVSGDGAYDTRGIYRAVHARSAAVIVPPRRNSKPWKDRADFAQAWNDCGFR